MAVENPAWTARLGGVLLIIEIGQSRSENQPSPDSESPMEMSTSEATAMIIVQCGTCLTDPRQKEDLVNTLEQIVSSPNPVRRIRQLDEAMEVCAGQRLGARFARTLESGMFDEAAMPELLMFALAEIVTCHFCTNGGDRNLFIMFDEELLGTAWQFTDPITFRHPFLWKLDEYRKSSNSSRQAVTLLAELRMSQGQQKSRKRPTRQIVRASEQSPAQNPPEGVPVVFEESSQEDFAEMFANV